MGARLFWFHHRAALPYFGKANETFLSNSWRLWNGSKNVTWGGTFFALVTMLWNDTPLVFLSISECRKMLKQLQCEFVENIHTVRDEVMLVPSLTLRQAFRHCDVRDISQHDCPHQSAEIFTVSKQQKNAVNDVIQSNCLNITVVEIVRHKSSSVNALLRNWPPYQRNGKF